ncbi:MAG: hypothetical protein D6702_12095 [Planctomycetota bacterium]|nr:MAG: hypothetical protein D6702_12095 [Planctomycetota bacterium]
MIAAVLVLALAPAAPQGVGHVRSRIEPGGEPLALEFADADGDGLLDLFLAVRDEDGRRWIRIHRLRADGALPVEPDHAVELKKDIVAWGLGDFTPEEPGVELLLTTRAGAYALPTAAEGYRGIRRLAAAEMLLDLPSSRQLPFWPAVADVDRDGRDDLALPVGDGFLIAGGDGSLLGRIELRPASGIPPALSRSFKLGPVTVSAQPLADLFVPDEDPGAIEPPPAVYAAEQLPLPFLVDADGDGLLDLIYAWQETIAVHLQRPAGQEPRFPAAADRWYAYGGEEGREIVGLELVDAGGGPAADLLVTRRSKDVDLSGDWEVLLFLDPFREPRPLARPDAVAATEASLVLPYLTRLAPDDGRPDLVLSAWTLEVGLLGAGGVGFQHRLLFYPAAPAGGFPRRPELSYERDYAADDFTAFSRVPPVPADVLGDGGADLIESDPHGALEIRPITAAAGRLEVGQDPARRIEVDALASEVRVVDLDRNGIGDLVVLRPGSLEVRVARRN